MLGFHEITPQNTDFEVLKVHFPQCFTREGAFDFDKFKAEVVPRQINFSKESYGLHWLGKAYARLLATDKTTTFLSEDFVHNSLPENQNSENILIEGDNLEVLKHLSNVYYQKVKMIYIDPPYNTGSDGFVYSDDRKFSSEQLQKLAGIEEYEAERILEFTQSKSNSHSAWLTFMYPRLYIARRLLTDDGVIFISIDDNEVAQLRLLCDEIFGEENFISELIWKNKRGGTNDSRFFANDHEYILCYAKNHQKLSLNLDKNAKVSTSYNLEDEKGKYALDRLDKQSLGYLKSLDFPIIAPDGTEYKIFHKDPKNKVARWRWGKETIKERYDELVFKDGFVYTKNYEKECGAIPRSLLIEERFGRTRTGKTDFVSLFGGSYFSAPKPVKLIDFLIQISTQKDDLILDFFSGSGTTAHAVMQLNMADGGNRRFILVQLPEPIDNMKNKVAYDFVREELGVCEPTIFEITKERILRAADRLNSELDNKLRSLQEELPMVENESEIAKVLTLKSQNSFKIFETIPLWEDYDFRAIKLSDGVNLFDEAKLTSEDIKALFITWKTNDGIPLTEPVETVDLSGYQGYYVRDKLYLMHKGFSTDALRSMLERIDLDVNFNPSVIIAFGYYFESKVLREIAENIKSYTNKKNIDIKFIIRY